MDMTPEEIEAERPGFEKVAESLDLPTSRIWVFLGGKSGAAEYADQRTQAAFRTWLARAEIANRDLEDERLDHLAYAARHDDWDE